MTNEDMLTRLIAEDEAHGGDIVRLRAIVEEASETGARRALARLGLADDQARRDVDELRELLRGWRDAKSGAMKAALAWIGRGLLTLLLIGAAIKMGAGAWMR